MNIGDIKQRYDDLSAELKYALARMEKTDRVIAIREAIKELQKICPHDNNFSETKECPYCGKKLR